MLRFIFLNAFIAIYTIIVSLFVFLLALFDQNGKRVHLHGAVPWAKAILWVCRVKVSVKGTDHLKGNGPYIFMVNHQSIFDIFALLASLPVEFKFILKQELMQIPLFGPAMKRAGYISIDRGNPRKAIKSMNEAAEMIKRGISVVIFPEGTRSADGRLLPFKPGGFHVALKGGCELVPIAVLNSHRITPKGSLRINKGVISMNIGRPISNEGYSKKNMDLLMKRVREAMIYELGESYQS